MKLRDLLPRREALMLRLKRAYRRSEIRKLLLWFKEKTLSPIHYLVLASFLVGGSQGMQYYQHGMVDVVRVNGSEVGLVRDAAEVEQYIDELMEKCSKLYGMKVTPQQEITFTREFHPRREADFHLVAEALRQQIDLVTAAVMVTVDGCPAVPVSTEEELERLATLLRLAYVSADDEVTLLEAVLLEKVRGYDCVVPPEQVYSTENAAVVLTGQERLPAPLIASRDPLASRSGRAEYEDPAGVVPEMPVVHVQIVEMTTVEERIPFETTYQNNSSMWSGQSRVITAGKEGLKKVTYRVTRVNDEEQARESVSEQVIQEPVTCIVERGTASRFTWPVAGGGRISQYFKGFAHRGIDIAAPMGTSVLAAESGTVVRSAWGSSQGNYIVINHGTYWTLYLHHSANLVSAGQWVSRGQVIARVGSTGHSTGPHLHFEVRRNNGSGIWSGWYDHPALDPLQFIR